MGNFDECQVCKPPKRRPGCQDHCPEYKKAKAKFEKKKAEEKRRCGVSSATHSKRDYSVNKALQKIRNRGG